MTALWWEGPFLSFDVESTGTDPETARIVTAACITVGSEGVLERKTWLVNPGVIIPAEATEIHGVTTERAQADGIDAALAVEQIADTLYASWRAGIPAVAMNCTYDFTVLSREQARHGMPPTTVGPALDPLVIDRAIAPRRRGKRKLVDLARIYGVRLDGAHSADEDALTAARVVWQQARHPSGRVLQLMTLTEMQSWQADQHELWAKNFQDFLRTKATPRQPDAVILPYWPVQPSLTPEGAPA